MSILGDVILNLIATEGGKTGLSGYALSVLLRKPAAHFWHATHTQIYSELERLHGDGYLIYNVEEQDGKPDKKVYRLTERGYERLKAWVIEPTDIVVQRNEFLVKALGIWLADPEQSIARFREQTELHQSNLEKFEEFMRITEQEWEREGKRQDTPTFGRYILLRYLLQQERDTINWCHWVISILS